jgi:aminoglycoside phosphotransferase (APT) family kinase protein
MHAVYRLVGIPVVVRIALSRAVARRAGHSLRTAERLAAHGIPVARPWGGGTRPVVVAGMTATVWRDAGPALRPADPADLAQLLRVLHAVRWGHPSRQRVLSGVLADLRRTLRDDTGSTVSDAERRYLWERCDDMSSLLARVDTGVDRMLHGDAHLGNVVVGPEGPRLCDLEAAGVGPLAWDLTPMMVAARRFGRPASWWKSFAAVYGVDEGSSSSEDGVEALRRLRELQMIIGALPVAPTVPGLVEEVRHRLNSVRCDDDALWTPYPRVHPPPAAAALRLIPRTATAASPPVRRAARIR